VNAFVVVPKFPNLPLRRFFGIDIKSSCLECFDIAAYTPLVQRGEPQFIDQGVAKIL